MRIRTRFGVRLLLAGALAICLSPVTRVPSALAQEQEPQGADSDGVKIHGRHNPFGPAFPDQAEKQKKRILQENLEKSRKDAEELASLAHDLQKELGRNADTPISPDMMLQLDRIEKLAKKIRGELEGY